MPTTIISHVLSHLSLYLAHTAHAIKDGEAQSKVQQISERRNVS